MIEKTNDSELVEVNLSVHLFATSAAMVGVCLTVIGLLRIVTTMKPIQTAGDDLLAVDAMLFLCSTFSSYGALKASFKSQRHQRERIADTVFLSALSVMAIVCILIVYALTER
ncbi:hypothetical protein [Armatimonas rosea]|uniref:Uncharacterized protein n=1 Tax=Armatimonas rosea TaxID=685828 RepID=A0A7W9ST21_ARMRO|nr:hypothetical protein [Armatimonas rosea]MBB6051434.1 hypothetical protein [Armatimonas rosea]